MGMKPIHGKSGTKVYRAWEGMLSRCRKPSNPEYPRYGGRGITVCERWHSFEAFLQDMGEPAPGESLERDRVNGNYEPGNCRWIPLEDQCLNTRRTRRLTAFGETKPVVLWLRDSRCIVGKDTILARLRRGWSHEDAIAKPPISFRDAGRMRHGVTR